MKIGMRILRGAKILTQCEFEVEAEGDLGKGAAACLDRFRREHPGLSPWDNDISIKFARLG